jgi:hypothetical protein
MADREGRLTFCFDHNLGQQMSALLGRARAQAHDRITDFHKLNIPSDAPDENWMATLGTLGRFAVITRDGKILQAATRRIAWRKSGITLFLLAERWGELKLHDLFRGLIFWWPAIVQHADAAAAGTAWTVSPKVPHWDKGGIHQVRPPEDTGPVA